LWSDPNDLPSTSPFPLPPFTLNRTHRTPHTYKCSLPTFFLLFQEDLLSFFELHLLVGPCTPLVFPHPFPPLPLSSPISLASVGIGLHHIPGLPPRLASLFLFSSPSISSLVNGICSPLSRCPTYCLFLPFTFLSSPAAFFYPTLSPPPATFTYLLFSTSSPRAPNALHPLYRLPRFPPGRALPYLLFLLLPHFSRPLSNAQSVSRGDSPPFASEVCPPPPASLPLCQQSPLPLKFAAIVWALFLLKSPIFSSTFNKVFFF